MPRVHDTQLACWGRHPVEPVRALRPEKWGDLDRAITDPDLPSVLARGLGRSYGDAALNRDAGLVLTERLGRVLDFDPDTGRLRAEAGCSLGTLIDRFLPRGFFPPVVPGTRFVTLGGAVAADVHGKNHHAAGSFASYVHRLELLDAQGRARWISRDDDPDAFHATTGGMGLTGVIRQVELDLAAVPSAWIDQHTERARNLDHALELFATRFDDFTYSVAWIDCLSGGDKLGRSVLLGGEHAQPDQLAARHRARPHEAPAERSKGVPLDFPTFALNAMSVRAFNAIYYVRAKPGRAVIDQRRFFHPLDAVHHWNRIYGKPGFQQYQTVLPFDADGGRESATGALREILTRLAKSQRASFLAVLKRFGDEGEGLLSFPKPGWTLTLDLPQRTGLDKLLRELDAITIDAGGRRYLAKDASLTREDFERMEGERLERFKAVRTRLDPGGRFSSSLGRRLGLVP